MSPLEAAVQVIQAMEGFAGQSTIRLAHGILLVPGAYEYARRKVLEMEAAREAVAILDAYHRRPVETSPTG